MTKEHKREFARKVINDPKQDLIQIYELRNSPKSCFGVDGRNH
jgi:hypothetical protein